MSKAKKQHPKEKAPPRVKDEKKVLAGKARALKSIRIDGKFTTNAFLEKITQDAQDSGVKDPYQFFLQAQNEYEEMYRNEELTPKRDFEKLRAAFKGFTGDTYKNGKKVKAATVIKALDELNQYLMVEHQVVNFKAKLHLGLFSGKLKINIPSPAKIKKMINEGEDFGDFMEDQFDVYIIKSPKNKQLKKYIRDYKAKQKSKTKKPKK